MRDTLKDLYVIVKVMVLATAYLVFAPLIWLWIWITGGYEDK